MQLALIAGTPHEAYVLDWATAAKHIEIHVSFLFPDGVALIRKLLRHAPVDVTVSTYMRATRKAALVELRTVLVDTKRKHRLRVRVATCDRNGYHGKVYRFAYANGLSRVVVGSANLSKAGLYGRGDVSLVAFGKNDHVPDLGKVSVPALDGLRWATRSEPHPLDEAIACYTESVLGGLLAEGVGSGVYCFVGVTDTNPNEDAFLEAVAAGDADAIESEGDMVPDAMRYIVAPGERAKWRLASMVQVGDAIFLGTRGERPRLRAYTCVGKFRGQAPPLRTERIVLNLQHKADVTIAPPRWATAVVPREDVPAEVLHALNAQ